MRKILIFCFIIKSAAALNCYQCRSTVDCNKGFCGDAIFHSCVKRITVSASVVKIEKFCEQEDGPLGCHMSNRDRTITCRCNQHYCNAAATFNGACTDLWPASQCKHLIQQNTQRCLGAAQEYFRTNICCKSCEDFLGGSNKAGQSDKYKGNIANCKDTYAASFCTAVVNNNWCASHGPAFCKKSCGLCTVDRYKTTAACDPATACTVANQQTVCNAPGRNVHKCNTTTLKCACGSPTCDLTQGACNTDTDCSSDRKTAVGGCKCNSVSKKCSMATCNEGCTECQSDADCSSDLDSTIKGCVCDLEALVCTKCNTSKPCKVAADCNKPCDTCENGKCKTK